MALSQNTLATELENLTPTENAILAKTTLAQAFGDYVKGGEANSVPVIGAFVDTTCVPAMAGAMDFPVPGTAAGAAASISSGILAFWGAAVGAPASFIAGATIITPPPYATLIADLTTTFLANTAAANDLAVAAAAVAADFHPLTDGLGTATFGVPVHPIT